jgi:hypothetical protein
MTSGEIVFILKLAFGCVELFHPLSDYISCSRRSVLAHYYRYSRILEQSEKSVN